MSNVQEDAPGPIGATEFRYGLLRYLDQCEATGQEIRIQRRGREFRLRVVASRRSIADLPRRPGLLVDPESLPEVQAGAWRPDDDLP